MKQKKYLWAAAAAVVVLAAVIAAVLLQPGEEPAKTPAGTRPMRPVETAPAASETTAPTEQTLPTETVPVIQTQPTEPEETRPQRPVETVPVQTEKPVYQTVEFPVELEGGDLTVNSMFQFSGMNPDVDNLSGEDIAAIELTNTSDRHMRFAEVTAVLADGTTMTFRAEDVPSGMKVWAFSLEHEVVADLNSCEEVFGYAEFEDGDPLQSDLVAIRVNGMEITVRNVSGENLTDLRILCHSMLDGSSFGGRTYTYTVKSLPAGASTSIFAMDCILGEAAVVRVELDG